MTPRALLLAALGCVCVFAPGPGIAGPAALPPMSLPVAADRLLVVAPHPDDESLCCAGLIQRARALGADVAIVWITAGDAFELDALLVGHGVAPDSGTMIRLGRQRLGEAHAAADRLGVPRDLQFILGYPDRGITALMSGYTLHPYRSPYTGDTRVRYAGAVSPDAPFTGRSLENDLERVLDDYRPTLVFAAAPEDRHPDHRASGELVRRLLDRRSSLSSLRYWIVHARDWPRPLGLHPQLPLRPPAGSAARAWRTLPLTEAERRGKLAALSQHHSQMQIMAPALDAFVRSNEIFSTDP